MSDKIKCVMLIDDNEDDNYFHQIVMDDIQFCDQIKAVENGFDALDYLRSVTILPELIFLDINMPRMNGWEFLEQFKKLERNDKTDSVIIMLSTSLNPSDRKKAELFPEVRSFESKPLTDSILREIAGKYFKKVNG